MKGIKLFDPVIDEREVKKVVKTLKSGFWASGAGSGQVHEFETKLRHSLTQNLVSLLIAVQLHYTWLHHFVILKEKKLSYLPYHL